MAAFHGAGPVGPLRDLTPANVPNNHLEPLVNALLNENDALKQLIAQRDADSVHRATDGVGTNEQLLIDTLCNRTKGQLDRINRIYHDKYGKSLLQVVSGDVGGNYGKIIKYALMNPEDYGAEMFTQACAGAGTNEQMLIDLVCTRSNAEMAATKRQWEARNGKSMIDTLKSELRGDMEKIMLYTVSHGRGEDPRVNEGLAAEQAQRLHKAGVGRMGTDEKTFIEILVGQSRQQIQAIKAAYERNHGMSLQKAIEKETSGNFEDILVALLSPSVEAYTALGLFKAFKGIGTDEGRVCRLLGGLDKERMGSVSSYYQDIYGRSLKESLKSELSGDFLRACTAWACGVDPTKGMEYRLAHTNNDPRSLALGLLEEHHNLWNHVCWADAQLVREASAGMGTNDNLLIKVVCGAPDKRHLQLVDAHYHDLFGKSLLDQIKSETSGDYGRFMEYLVMPQDDFDAYVIKKAMDGLGTNESMLIMALAPLSNRRMRGARARHDAKYGKPLIDRLHSELSGDLRNLIMEIIKAERDESTHVDQHQAHALANELQQAGRGKWGTNEATFVRILTKTSRAQLEAVKAAYEKDHGESLSRAIVKEMSGYVEEACLALLADPADYYSQKLRKAFEGVGTDEDTVCFIVAGSDKPLAHAIGTRYFQRYNQTLKEAFKSELSGNFKTAALTWLEGLDAVSAYRKH